MFKLALNAGHGINTPGKRCLRSIDIKETREWTLNSRICDLIEKYLSDYEGYSLIRLDDKSGKTDVPLKTRTSKANAFGADFYLSIHHNAGINGRAGGGVITIVYKTIKDGSPTAAWQKALYEAIVSATGLKGNRSNPLQKQDLHELRESKMPAVLLECGFMDSTTDTPVILTDAFAQKTAKAIVEVLAERGGLRKKTASAKQSETAAPVARKKTVDELAKEVIRGLWGNGNERKTRLCNAGYSYRDVQARVNELLR